MTVLVVSQPMYLPWIGIFEQMRMADIFVHYDDVQLPQGRSFINRVQVKTAAGPRWLTVPIDRANSGALICESRIAEAQAPRHSWRGTHFETLRHAYGKGTHFSATESLAREILAEPAPDLASFNIAALERLATAIGLRPRFLRASSLGIGGSSSARLIEICRATGASTYLTGHGARHYLDCAAFERAGIEVRFIEYRARPWPQPHGDFTPFVTLLDLLSAVPASRAQGHFGARSVPWRDFLASPSGAAG